MENKTTRHKANTQEERQIKPKMQNDGTTKSKYKISPNNQTLTIRPNNQTVNKRGNKLGIKRLN